MCAAKAAIIDDPLADARDLAIVLVLGDAGLRCAELAGLERRSGVRRRNELGSGRWPAAAPLTAERQAVRRVAMLPGIEAGE